MKKNMHITRVACYAAIALSVGTAQAAAIDRLPSCEGAAWSDTCRVDVPNGSLVGPPDDALFHRASWGGAWEPEPLRHSVAEHVAPWRYVDGSGHRYQHDTAEASFAIGHPGDGLSQVIPLPTQDLPPMHDVVYAVRAHVDPVRGAARVDLKASVQRRGVSLDASEGGATIGRPTPGGIGRTILAWVLVPAGETADAIHVEVNVEAADGPVAVKGVEIVRADEAADRSWLTSFR